jgi:hypothetical protein
LAAHSAHAFDFANRSNDVSNFTRLQGAARAAALLLGDIWALYSCADLVLSAAATFNTSSAAPLPSLLQSVLAFAQKVLPSPRNAVSYPLGLDRAIVGMRLLPDVTAGQAAAIVIVLFLPFVFHCIRNRNNDGGRTMISQTMQMMAAAALCFFMAGCHVHEKPILICVMLFIPIPAVHFAYWEARGSALSPSRPSCRSSTRYDGLACSCSSRTRCSR